MKIFGTQQLLSSMHCAFLQLTMTTCSQYTTLYELHKTRLAPKIQ